MQQANKNEVRKEIALLIDLIKTQSDRIGNQREIPQEELDVILHRIEELHRKTVVWCYLNTLPDAEEAVPDTSLASQVAAVIAEVNPEPLATEENNKAEPVQEKIEAQPKEEQPQANVEIPQSSVNTGTRNLKDIRSFIGFNEKLMYIRQLFAGDTDAFNAALDQINTMESHPEAESFLNVVGAEFRWVKDSEPVVIFTLTVKRRFS